MKPRVILADDHALFLDGLRLILSEDYEVVESVMDARALVQAVEKLRPDIVVLDIGMSLLAGLEAMRQLRQTYPSIKFVVTSQRSDVTFVRAALEAGARGYFLKQSPAHEFKRALRAVLDGEYFITPALTALSKADQILTALSKADQIRDGSAARFRTGLTSRQREVLQLIAEGKSAKEVASILKISPKTVEFHKASIVETLGIRTTAELTRYALLKGISVP
jgi:DNA-binding NarL/FixJ family response regulator